jgi:rubrerythrin
MERAAAEALATGIEAEKASLRQYLGWAWRTRDPAGRAMFIRLAIDEFEHMSMLERQRVGLEQTGEWQPVEPARTMLEQLVPRLSDNSLRIRGTAGQNDRSALESALELEVRARDFYAEQARSGAEAGRPVFGRLAEMEQAHVELVQAELDSITGSGFWFGLQEFSLETEA